MTTALGGSAASRRPRIARALAATAALGGAMLLAACAGTVSTGTHTRIEVEEDVGFTITEDARVGAGVRADYDDAIALLEQGRHDAGIELLGSVVERAPGLSAPLIDLGIAEHRAGNLEAAETHLLAALEIAPEHPIAHNELGIVYRKSGRFAEARARYEAALAVYPGYHVARRNLAILCDLYLGDLQCALEHYQAYMASVSSDEEVSMWITDLRHRLGR